TCPSPRLQERRRASAEWRHFQRKKLSKKAGGFRPPLTSSIRLQSRARCGDQLRWERRHARRTIELLISKRIMQYTKMCDARLHKTKEIKCR
ncbi:Protein of unknown function, partial [Gryllus bimaculatus]